MSGSNCVICNEPLGNGQVLITIREKGAKTINEVSSKHRHQNVFVVAGQILHQECRKKYTNAKEIQKIGKENTDNDRFDRLTRSSQYFDFREHCLFCGQSAQMSDSKYGIEVYPVRTFEFQQKIDAICKDRKDSWAADVLAKLEYAQDLPAADAIYHQKCSVNFRTGKKIPIGGTPEQKRKKQGRPDHIEANTAFLKTMDYLLENEEDQLTVKDLVHQMTQFCGDLAYTTVHMKSKIKTHFGDEAFITDVCGKPNVVTLRKTASVLLQEFHQSQKTSDPETEKIDIIKTAAKLIKSDIKSMEFSRAVYPSPATIASCEENIAYLPDSLKQLLGGIFSEKDCDLKVAAIGQSIMQATRPRSLIAPLQLGLGVQMHHHFGSKFLLDTLYQLGFSSSYKEVQKHGVNSALQGDDSPQDLEGRCIQHVADNVDHNIRTLDGHGTFHGMGIIAGITPGYNHKTIVQRLNVSLDDIKQIGKIDLHQYNFDRTSKLSLKFESLAAQQSGALPDNISLLCSTLWPKKRIGWSAMCNLVQDGAYPGKSTIVFLPMIDLEPGNLSCIFSTMKFVCNEAFKYRANPMLTFDQPLYWKALTIFDNEPKDSDLKSIVLRLGGFHLEMSFLGSIGNIMRGSGLAELMETVYAPNAVTHMFTGKAVARAVRGHFLIYNALTSLLLCEQFHVSSTVLKDHDTENVEHLSSLEDYEIHNENTFIQDLNKLSYIFDEILERHLPVDTLDQNEVLRKIRDSISTFRKSHIENRTARLWFLYMDMVDLLRNFIKAERTGNWTLHLQTIQKMLPYFAAAGHNLYLKSAYVYLQQMHGLSRTNPAINEALMSGFHVMRRSDRFWSS